MHSRSSVVGRSKELMKHLFRALAIFDRKLSQDFVTIELYGLINLSLLLYRDKFSARSTSLLIRLVTKFLL